MGGMTQELREQNAMFTAAVSAATSTPTKTGGGGGAFISLAEHRALVARRLEAQREESARGLDELRADLKRRSGEGEGEEEGSSGEYNRLSFHRLFVQYPSDPLPSHMRLGMPIESESSNNRLIGRLNR